MRQASWQPGTILADIELSTPQYVTLHYLQHRYTAVEHREDVSSTLSTDPAPSMTFAHDTCIQQHHDVLDSSPLPPPLPSPPFGTKFHIYQSNVSHCEAKRRSFDDWVNKWNTSTLPCGQSAGNKKQNNMVLAATFAFYWHVQSYTVLGLSLTVAPTHVQSYTVLDAASPWHLHTSKAIPCWTQPHRGTYTTWDLWHFYKF